LDAGATGQCLPNSNQPRRGDIRQAGTIDRRAIPPAAVESRWSAGDGQAIRRVDWPGGARGSILFLPGRGDFYEKYLETLDAWRRAGWRVTAADWRGQAGSGRLGADAVTGHIGDFAEWVGDLAALWQAWKAETPGPHVLAGHSMGGHLALRAAVERKVDPDAIVLSAPMLGFLGPLPNGVMHAAAALMMRLGDPRRPAWKWSEKPGEVPAGRIDLLTHDKDRYGDELYWREARPELVMGPGSWGWVERAYASMRALFAPGALEAMKIPVLIVATSNDKLVAFGAIERAAARLPHAELVRFGDEAHHEILREADPVRDRAMKAIDKFLDRVAPAENGAAH
jgi:lysophospholipase